MGESGQTTNEAADRLRDWIPTAENAAGETMSTADLDAALDTERRNVVAEIRKVQRYDLDGYPGAETFQPSASGDYVMADALDARLDELEGEDR